jgi:hypothetical protein
VKKQIIPWLTEEKSGPRKVAGKLGNDKYKNLWPSYKFPQQPVMDARVTKKKVASSRSLFPNIKPTYWIVG